MTPISDTSDLAYHDKMNGNAHHWRDWMRSLGRVFVKLVVAVVSLELLVYLGTWWFQVSPLVLAEKSRGWRMAPHAMIPLTNEEGPYQFRVNANGRRDRHANPSTSPSRSRILVLGGSNTVGVSVPMDDVYTQVLERSLPDVDVINLGVVVYELDQQLLLLREELPRWKPALVIHLINQDTYKYIFRDYEPRMGLPRCHVEITSGDVGYRIVPPRFPWWQFLASQSVLVSTFDMLLYRRWTDENSASVPSEMTPEQAQVVRRLVLDTREAAHQHGSRYVAVVACASRQDRPTGELRILRELAHSNGITFLDLSHLFTSDDSDAESPPLVLREDPGHWSVYGHHTVARELQRFLDESTP